MLTPTATRSTPLSFQSACACTAILSCLTVVLLTVFDVMYNNYRQERVMSQQGRKIYLSQVELVANDKQLPSDSQPSFDWRRRLESDFGCIASFDGSSVSAEDINSKLTEDTIFINCNRDDVTNFCSPNPCSVTITDADFQSMTFRIEANQGTETAAVFATIDGLDPSCTVQTLEENCFSADSIAYRLVNETTGAYESVKLRDVSIDDVVMTDLTRKFGKVLYRVHYIQPSHLDSVGNLTRFCFHDGSCKFVSEQHLVFVNGVELQNLINAGSIKVGDTMFSVKEPNRPKVVISVSRNIRSEIRNVMTEDGTIIVDDMYYSCFIGKNVYDHLWYFRILKFLYWLLNDVINDRLEFVFGVNFSKLWRDDLFAFEVSDRIVDFTNWYVLPITNAVTGVGYFANNNSVIVSVAAIVVTFAVIQKRIYL